MFGFFADFFLENKNKKYDQLYSEIKSGVVVDEKSLRNYIEFCKKSGHLLEYERLVSELVYEILTAVNTHKFSTAIYFYLCAISRAKKFNIDKYNSRLEALGYNIIYMGIKEGINYIQSGDLENAQRCYEEVFKFTPENYNEEKLIKLRKGFEILGKKIIVSYIEKGLNSENLQEIVSFKQIAYNKAKEYRVSSLLNSEFNVLNRHLDFVSSRMQEFNELAKVNY